MKKLRNLLIGLAGLSLSVGAAIGVGLSADKGAKEAKADRPTTIYLDLGSCNWASKKKPIRAHLFTGETAYTDWNTESVAQMAEDTDFKGLYSIDISSYSLAESVIFHVSTWGDDCQTVDLTIPTDGKNLFTITTSYTDGTKQDGSWSTYGTSTVYVLDKYGDLLNVSHKAHMYKTGVGTEWSGKVMTQVSGNIYSVTYYNALTTVNFNQIGDGGKTGQTKNLSLVGHANKCLILDHTVGTIGDDTGKWISDTWVELPVAQYIDTYMHFADFDESVDTDGVACKTADGEGETPYTLAKKAYEAVSFASYREELCSLDYVVARLQAWARANSKTFTVTDGIGAFSSAQIVAREVETTNNNTTLIAIIAISAISLLAVGGYFFIRSKKEDR